MRKLFYFFAIVFIAANIYAGDSFSIKDSTGNNLTFDGKIQRVISLSPAVTESVFLLGKGNLLVGVTTYCTRPVEAQKLEKIGGVVDPNLEKIVSLKPDVVIAIDQFSILKKIGALKDYGIKVFVLAKRSDFQSITDEFLLLGKLFNEEKLSIKMVDEAKKEISSIGKKVRLKKKKPDVFWQIGIKPIFTAGGNTFPGNIIYLAGGNNIADQIDGYRELSLEKIVELNPDIIISPEMGSLKNNIGIWDDYSVVKASKNKKIFVIDENESSAPTIVTFVSTVKKLFEYFYN